MAESLSIVDGALKPILLCYLDQLMLNEVMAEIRGQTNTYFTNRVHIKCRGCPTLWGCSMVCIGKNIANCSKKTPFSPCHVCAVCVVRALCARYADMPLVSPLRLGHLREDGTPRVTLLAGPSWGAGRRQPLNC